MGKNQRKTMRHVYVPPRIGVFCLSDADSHLLDTSIGTFEDMEQGGDLGGDSGNNGSFSDMGSGGDLGSDLTKEDGSSFSDMMWGGDLGGTVTGGN